jgi:hypothetical protein
MSGQKMPRSFRDQGNAQIKELAYDRDYTAGAGRLS